MLFKRKPKLSLQLAIYLCEQITDIAYGYKNDTDFMPSTVDMKRFEELADKLWATHVAIQHVVSCMHSRVAGEAEGARKYADPEVANHQTTPLYTTEFPVPLFAMEESA